MNKTTVIYHSADFDGLFCREIARKFLPEAELIGWTFGDKPLDFPNEGIVYVMDLPVDRVFVPESTLAVDDGQLCFLTTTPPPKRFPINRLVWIDHHVTSIETHPSRITGYRIDGVSACRLAWQWFRVFATYDGSNGHHNAEQWENPMADALPKKEVFVERRVSEPLAVRLAGEYDIFDKRDPNAELFQFGLRSELINWQRLLSCQERERPDNDLEACNDYVAQLLEQGKPLRYAREQEYLDVILEQGFDLQFEGLNFLACNSHESDIRSQLFESGIQPEHDALLGFTWNGVGKHWRISFYRIPGKDVDILRIAKKYGGGGHPGACGCTPKVLPFELS